MTAPSVAKTSASDLCILGVQQVINSLRDILYATGNFNIFSLQQFLLKSHIKHAVLHVDVKVAYNGKCVCTGCLWYT